MELGSLGRSVSICMMPACLAICSVVDISRDNLDVLAATRSEEWENLDSRRPARIMSRIPVKLQPDRLIRER